MKKGISIWSFKEQPLEECFKLAKKAGFEGVEIALSEDGELNLSSAKEDILKIKDSAQQHGLTLYSVASGLYWKYSLTSETEQEREKAKSVVKKQLEIAAVLGCDTILVIPGSVSGLSNGAEPVAYDKVYDRAFSALTELAPFAEKAGVIIGIENVWNKFLLSPLEMRDLIDQVNSPYVAAYFDVGNVLTFGYPQHWIKILGNRIKKVHIKDFRMNVGTFGGFVDLLAGDVNFPEVINALNEISYDDWITAEIGPYKNYPEALIQNISTAMDYILGRDVS